MPLPTIHTKRLVLRPFRDDDLAAFAAMNADPRVMEHFPSTLGREESDALVGRIRAMVDAHGFAPWAVEIPGLAPFAGFVGLLAPSFEAHFTPCVEVGWRLAHEAWNQGYATEGARAAIAFGFESLGLREIVSMTTVENVRSRRVMEKLGMTRDANDDFDHPRIPEGHPTRRHVLYRLRSTA